LPCRKDSNKPCLPARQGKVKAGEKKLKIYMSGYNEIARAFAYVHALGGLTGFVISFHIGTLISFLRLPCKFS
jgi:hypothetical protein